MGLQWNEPDSYISDCGSLLRSELPHHTCLDRGSYISGCCMPRSDHTLSSLHIPVCMQEGCLWSRERTSIRLARLFRGTDCWVRMATDCTAASPQALHGTHGKTLDRQKKSQAANDNHTAKQYVINKSANPKANRQKAKIFCIKY